MILLAAQMACLTASGAAAGAAARPSTIFASVPGTVGWASAAPVAVVDVAGVAAGSSYAVPPGPSAAMADGAALSASANSTQMIIRDFPRTTCSLSSACGVS